MMMCSSTEMPRSSPALLQPVRDVFVLRRGRRVPARVVVRHDDRNGIVQYGGREDVAGMHHRGVDRPNRYNLFMYQLVPRIEIQPHEMLLALCFDVLELLYRLRGLLYER